MNKPYENGGNLTCKMRIGLIGGAQVELSIPVGCVV